MLQVTDYKLAVLINPLWRGSTYVYPRLGNFILYTYCLMVYFINIQFEKYQMNYL